MAPMVAMRFMVFSLLVDPHVPRVGAARRRVVRARDVANVTVVTQTARMEWPLLADLPPEDVRQLLSIARRRTFARGEVVFHRDDPADSLHLVVRGRFGARVLTPLGDSVLVDVLGPGPELRRARAAPPGRAALGDGRGARGRRDALGLPRRLRACSSASTPA